MTYACTTIFLILDISFSNILLVYIIPLTTYTVSLLCCGKLMCIPVVLCVYFERVFLQAPVSSEPHIYIYR